MNFEKISDKYPNAFKLLICHINGFGIPSKYENGFIKLFDKMGYRGFSEYFETRSLFEFFDKVEIIISIQGFINDENEKIFDYCIQERNTLNGMAGDWFKNRNDCKKRAFTKAFEILENNLKQ